MLNMKSVVKIIKIADSDPIPLPKEDRPLRGMKTLDLHLVLARPIYARNLAEHGSDALMIIAEHLP